MGEINLDFCIIENPLDKNKKPIIFVTRKGVKYLDETVIVEDDYEKAVFVIQNMGYIESDTLTFESSQDPEYVFVTTQHIRDSLEQIGMKYSTELENSVKIEFATLNTESAKQLIRTIANQDRFENYTHSDFKKNFQRPTKYKLIDVGDRLTLYFYLFVECKFQRDKCFLNLNGDFTSKTNTDLRNFILPVKCDFVRVNNVYSPNKIILKNVQTNRGVLKQIPINFHGTFSSKHIKNLHTIEKTFIYYFFEVKNNIPLDNRITIEIDSSESFDQMINMSKSIKTEYSLLMSKPQIVDTEFKDALFKIKDILTPRMWSLADSDEFEKATTTKKDVLHIKKMITKVNNCISEKKEMDLHKFLKTFPTTY